VTFRDIQLLDMHHSNNLKTIVRSLRIGFPCCQYLYSCFTLHRTTLYQNPLPYFDPHWGDTRVLFGWWSQNVTEETQWIVQTISNKPLSNRPPMQCNSNSNSNNRLSATIIAKVWCYGRRCYHKFRMNKGMIGSGDGMTVLPCKFCQRVIPVELHSLPTTNVHSTLP
jgi:hypothetical protein